VVQTPQVLELSGIGNREVFSAAGINTMVESPSVGANFQDHVLGGMVFECAPDVISLDALHGDEYGQKQQMIYEKEHTGPFGSPGMLMGFVSYASFVSEQELQTTIAEIKNKLPSQNTVREETRKINHRPIERPRVCKPVDVLDTSEYGPYRLWRSNQIPRSSTEREESCCATYMSRAPAQQRLNTYHVLRPHETATHRPRVSPQ
jgi:hypothetical protein